MSTKIQLVSETVYLSKIKIVSLVIQETKSFIMLNQIIKYRIQLVVILLFLFMYSQVNICYSQSVTFNRYYDTLSNDLFNEFTSIVETDSGFTLINSMAFTIHYLDSFGNLIFEKNFRDTSIIRDFYWDWNRNIDIVEETPESNEFYIQASGLTRQYSDTVFSSAYHLTKFDYNFDTVWTSKIVYIDSITPSNYQGPGDLYDCVVDDNNFIYATGYGSMLLDSMLFSNYGNIIFLKADSYGNPLIIRNYPFINSNEDNMGNRIIETFDDNILIGGSLDYFPQTAYITNARCYLLKVNKFGDFIWHKAINGVVFMDLIQAKDSSLIIVGVDGYFSIMAASGDAYISKLTPEGTTIWETRIGTGMPALDSFS